MLNTAVLLALVANTHGLALGRGDDVPNLTACPEAAQAKQNTAFAATIQNSIKKNLDTRVVWEGVVAEYARIGLVIIDGEENVSNAKCGVVFKQVEKALATLTKHMGSWVDACQPKGEEEGIKKFFNDKVPAVGGGSWGVRSGLLG